MKKDEGHLIKFLNNFVSKERFKLFEEKVDLRTKYITIVLEDVYQARNIS